MDWKMHKKKKLTDVGSHFFVWYVCFASSLEPNNFHYGLYQCISMLFLNGGLLITA